ncbi:MAG: DUF6261 family protein [Tannerella sp.]|jgi:hypothetical protein|nr:DUF6261 family protein [Tannerella sp.]
MKILKIHFQHLRNEAHYQLLLLVQKLFGNYPAVAALVTDLLTPFFDLLTLEGQLVDAVRGSVYTEELAEADRRVDRDVAGINAAVASALHHFDPALVAAAKYVEIRLKSFHGEIEKKAYEEESAAVKILVTDLQGEYAEQVAILSLGPWVAELAAAQEDFERIFLLRSDKRATQPKERLRDVRKQIDAVYRQIVDRIDAYTLLNGDSVTGLFIEHLNDEITYFNEHDHRHARKDIDHAVVASIPDQPWKGKPVIVLPEVTYEGKELVFTKDYELSYHDNSRPGTAAVHIHGKGAFKGTKTVSFNIVVND